MTTKQAMEPSEDSDQGIAILSNHNRRPDASSMREYGLAATKEKPWEVRLKNASGGWKFSVMVTKVTALENNIWRMDGTLDGKPIVVHWSVVSRQGTLIYVGAEATS